MWLERLHAWIEQGIPCALATVTEAQGAVPRQAGAKMAVNAEGEIAGSVGGGAIEFRCLEEARKIFDMGAPRTLRFVLGVTDWKEATPEDEASTWPGRVSVFIEPLLPTGEIVAFGGGHICERLAKLCEVIGMPFRVYDERPEFANPERFPSARQAICASYEDIASYIHLFSVSHCIVLTHGHAYDEKVLGQLLSMPFLPYVGMVGSSKKNRRILDNLAAKGIAGGTNLYTPAGLALGGSQPGDIALSILAEIKLVMEGGRPEHLRTPI
jgi:xanthine dehydrogenase accessory factor